MFTDSSGYSQDSSVAVSVVSAATSLGVLPGASTVSAKSQAQFSAVDLDQFGNDLGIASSVTWSAASGTITSSGLYTTPASGTSDTVTATGGGLRGSTTVTIAAPAGWWKLNEGTGSTADDSGGGTADNGAITGSTWVQAPANIDEPNALQFNGSSTVVSLGSPNKLAISGQLTLAAWIKPANLSSEQFIIDDGTRTTNNFLLMINNGDYEVGSDSLSLKGAKYAIPSGDLNTWVFLAGTYDGTTWRLYRDGQLVASAAAVESTPSENWTIGAAKNISTTLYYFNGDISDVRVYGTAISSGAIAAMAGTPPVVTAAAASAPNPVAGVAAALSVAASDDAGPSALTYTWATTGTPPAAVRFSRNGTSAAYSTTAKFTKAGTYHFTVTIANAAGFTAASSLALTVNQTPATIGVVAGPQAGTGAVTFTAVALDQFGNALPSQPMLTWSLTSGGALSAAAGNQLTMSGPINANSLVVTGGGNVTVVGSNNNLANVDLASGEFIVEDPSILAAGANLTVGNAAFFPPSGAGPNNALANVDVASGKLVVKDPSILAAGSNLTVGNAALLRRSSPRRRRRRFPASRPGHPHPSSRAPRPPRHRPLLRRPSPRRRPRPQRRRPLRPHGQSPPRAPADRRWPLHWWQVGRKRRCNPLRLPTVPRCPCR